ncbi:HAD-IA family hydrolase [Peribacillus sp. SCS-155]|uniref:HAD-IA family hydrolase n=1 Tax=Peribacillus sedimenti TaxID=3115297 RepID=UPI0039065D08
MIDTETVWYESYRDVILKNHGVFVDLKEYSKCSGTGNAVLIKYFQQITKNALDFETIQVLALERYKEKLQTPILREGVLDYLLQAKELDLKIGLASSSSRSWVVDYLEQLQILEFFDILNTRNEVTAVKPNPELYLKTLYDLTLFPNEAIAFKDSLNGLLAAKSAGIYCVTVPNPVTKHLAFETQDFTINSMREKSLKQIISHIELQAAH